MLVEAILIKHGQPAWISTASIATLGILTILYTYSGGMFAVILADAIFIVLCLVAISLLGISLQTIPNMEGLRADIVTYDFSRLSVLDFLFYFSAASYVFLMFLFHPDFWYRNLRLPYASRGKRLLTIVFSAIFTSALLQVAYFIGASSRTEADRALLYNNLIDKKYDLESVFNLLEMVFHHEYSAIGLIFLILVSAFTTVSSLIISAVAGYYETDATYGADRYKALLREFFKLTILVTIIALTFDITMGIFAALIIASSQLTLTSSIICARAYRLRRSNYLSAILTSMLIFIVLAAANVLASLHFYYPFLAIISSAIAPIIIRISRRSEGAAKGHG